MPVERLAPEMDRIVPRRLVIEKLGEGYGGFDGPAEGPVWWKEGGYLLFSDIHGSRRMKWAPGEGVTVFHEPTNQANGQTRDLQGRLVVCEHQSRRLIRIEHDGSTTVMAKGYKGGPLNKPNDVIVKSDGAIYFTDPWIQRWLKNEWDPDFARVFRLSPDLGTMTLLAWDFIMPNGLAFSPDESVLYINDSRRKHIRAFDMLPIGIPDLSSNRVFCDLSGERPGNPDGMKVDIEGNVYCGGSGGIWVMDPSGKHLGTIVHEQPATTNMGWGDDDWRTLYFTTRDSLFRTRLNIPGMPVPTALPK